MDMGLAKPSFTHVRACVRAYLLPQFGDRLILDYITHQRRLLPGLATAYAMHLGILQIKVGRPGAGGPPA